MTALAAEVGRLAELVHDIGDAVAALTRPRHGDPELLTPRQWQWLAQALYDASEYRLRLADAACGDCDRHPEGLCEAHAAHWALIDSYHELACQLGATVPLPARVQPRRLRAVPSGGEGGPA